MRAEWEALRASFARYVATWSEVQRFERWRAEEVCLARARAPADLVAWLNQPGGDLDAKDDVYATLLARARGGGGDAPLARALLWLGLWPGLDALFHRAARRHPGEPAALVSEIAHQFCERLDRLDPRQARRVAAGLVRGTQREAGEGLRRAARGRAAGEPLDEGALPGAAGADAPGRRGLGYDDEAAAVRRWLADACGEDAELVYRAVVLEQNQREAGDALGLSHEAARKRLQRALARLRARLVDDG